VYLSYGRKLLLALLAGGALPLAYAPFGLFWLAPLSIASLFYVWRDLTPARAFWAGLVFGGASFFAGMHWIYVSVHDFGQAPVALAVFLTFGLVFTLALFIALAGWSAARWFSSDGPAAWLGIYPALWVLMEWWRGWFLSGLGWLAAGYSQTDSWLVGYAPIGGVYAMSWGVVITAGALVTLCLGATRMRAAAAALVVGIWWGGYALGEYRWTEPRQTLLTVALVQGAVPQDLKWQPEQLLPTLELYRSLTYESEGSDLIVWPEAAIPARYGQVSEYLADIRAWAEDHGSAVMLGILRDAPQGGTFQNTVVALTEPADFYVKHHLVPYGEYFPVPQLLRSWLRRMSLPYTDAVPGDPEQAPLRVAGEHVGVTICYEDVFGVELLHYFPEATVLVNVSNDAWFGNSIAPHQHLQIARVRAAETGRYLLRSTNTGVSGIIDPRGRVIGRSPQFEPHVLKGVIQGFVGATPYTRWGNYAVVLGALAVLVFQLPITKLTIRPGT